MQKNTQVIFSCDNEPRILQVIQNISEEKAWEIANLMANATTCDFEHYDVLSFDSLEEAMNYFIREARVYQRDFNKEIL